MSDQQLQELQQLADMAIREGELEAWNVMLQKSPSLEAADRKTNGLLRQMHQCGFGFGAEWYNKLRSSFVESR